MVEIRNKKILVTGGAGFIGGHFVEHLLNICSNTQIDVIDNLSVGSSTKTLGYLASLMSTTSNMLNYDFTGIESVEIDQDYDYIVNFAAQTHVDRSIEDGNSFVTSNVIGVNNLVSQINTKTRFVQISTDEVYGSIQQSQPASREDDLLIPSSPYSSTKAAGDLIALSYHRTHGKDVVVTRCTNNFGPRQYTEKFIPKSTHSLLNGEPVTVYGDGSNIRQWIYVMDHVEQILAVMLRGTPGEIYNISDSRYHTSEKTNIDVLHAICKILDCEPNIEFVADRLGHDFRYSVNGEKTLKLLSQRTHSSFEKDLATTIMWYKDNKDWWNEKTTTD